MKVKKLISLLQKMPQDLEVKSEGCDCIGEIKTAMLWSNYHINPDKQEFVLLVRPEEE